MIYKLAICIALLLANSQTQAQNSDTIYYFPNADSSYYGVKNQQGKILIPAQFLNIHEVEWDQPITEQTIEFMGLPADYDLTKSAVRIIAPYNTSVYNRSGKLLYHPQWFDNGSDYWVEGKRRFVDPQTGLVGFVDEEHQVIIPAQWEFATPFNCGYAEVFQGYQKHVEPGGEHWTIVPDPKKIANKAVINTRGDVVIGKTSPQSLTDYELDNLYYPNPFPYTAAEQKIVYNNEGHYRIEAPSPNEPLCNQD